jgi:integrase
MPSVKVLLKLNKQKPNGEYPLYIRITKDRRSKFISLGIYIQKKYWNENDSKLKSSHPNSARLNNLIAKNVKEAEALALDLELKNLSLSSINFKEAVKGKSSSSFLDYADTLINRLEKSGKIATYKRYKVIVNKLRSYKANSMAFEDFTVTFLKDYESYLISLGNSTNTIHTNLKTLRAILYQAIKENLFPQEKNPFFQFKLKTSKVEKQKLSKEEIRRIVNLDLEENSKLWHTRNYFMFSFYLAGIRFSDLAQLQWSNVVDNKLKYKMSKTGSTIEHLLTDSSNKILDFYRPNKINNSQFIFPILSQEKSLYSSKQLYNDISSKNAMINSTLKDLAKLAEIKKKISFHISRHSWADLARKGKMDIYSISKALRHSNITTTENYFKSLDDETLATEINRITEDI